MSSSNLNSAISSSQLAAVNDLLLRVFSQAKFADRAYLEWQYLQGPDGPAIFSNYMEEGTCVGHYCVLPQNYIRVDTQCRLALSLNTAVDHRFRLKGLFNKLAQETYAKARDQCGIKGIVGVANANSTPGFLGRLGFRLLGPLPVGIGFCPWFFKKNRKAKTFFVNDAFLASDSFDVIMDSLDFRSTGGLSQKWSPTKIKWRLSNPTANYKLHEACDGVLVSQTDQYNRLRVVILLKFFPKKEIRSIDSMALVGAACKDAGTPLFLYAGYNPATKLRLVRLPESLKPSPLNLIFKELDQMPAGSTDVSFETFEFFDFDVY